MTETVERMLPLYEAKMIHQFDHRWATYEADGSVRDVTREEKHDPSFVALPRYWVREEVVADRLDGRWDRDWMLGWRDICRSTDERTMIATINGSGASPEGGTLLSLPDPPLGAPALLAIWNSFAFDFVARQKVGGTHLKYFTIRQLPMPTPELLASPTPWDVTVSISAWLTARALALVLDTPEMDGLASDLGARRLHEAWDPERRSELRSELDAACFHLFGVTRDDAVYIMDTFHIAKRKDEAAHGAYVTKERILVVYDAMHTAIESGQPYESPLEPQLARLVET
jgi:hypothetical protein